MDTNRNSAVDIEQQRCSGDEDNACDVEEVTERGSKCSFTLVNKVWEGLSWKIKKPEADAGQLDENAFMVQKNFNWGNEYKDTSIIVNSKPLKAVLQATMQDVKGISLVDDIPEMLFSFLPEIRAGVKDLSPDTIEAQHCNLLLNHLEAHYMDTERKLWPMLENGIITFELLWALFRPGTIVVIRPPGFDDEYCCFEVDYVTKNSNSKKETKDYKDNYSIEGHYLDFNGRIFGYVDAKVTIDNFKGTRNITRLKAYPLAHCADKMLRTKLVERGKKFVHMVQRYVYSYDAQAKSPEGELLQVNGRIIVDELGYRQENAESDTKAHLVGLGIGKEDSVTEEQLLIASPYVCAFSLRQNRWAKFLVSHLQDIQWSDEAWDSLILKESNKKILEGILEVQRNQNHRLMTDLIESKGQGYIIVLHGSPGCGTLIQLIDIVNNL